jgi:rhamnosyl/mannosyltransferase
MVETYEKNTVLHEKWRIITPWINPFFFERTYPTRALSLRKQKMIPHSILFVGSLLPFKGAFVAVQTMKLLVAKFPHAQLLLVGSEQEHDSPYRQKLENIATYDNTLKNIQFLGKKTTEELRLLHRSSSVFVFPTVCMESFGQSWAEAMADGCPVILTDISTLPEYINHKETGLLIRPNDPRALAEAVISVFQNNDFAATIAKKGTKYARTHFSLDNTYPQICTLYSEL